MTRRERKFEFMKRIFGPTPKDELQYRGKASGNISMPGEFVYSGSFLSASEFRLWFVILSHCEHRDPNLRLSWPSQERLGVLVGKTPRQVMRDIKGLMRKGCLQVCKRTGRPNLYLLLDPPQAWMRQTKSLLLAKIAAKAIRKRTELLPSEKGEK